MPTFNETATLNYLEIIFTFSNSGQYIVRFGNFNINFFQSDFHFLRFLYKFLSHSEDSVEMTQGVRKISCYQRTQVEGWDADTFVPLTDWANAELVGDSEMPDWYGTGKWLFHDWAKDRLTDSAFPETNWNTLECIRAERAIYDFEAFWNYDEYFDEAVVERELDYVCIEGNLIYWGRMECCPCMDAKNIAMFPTDTAVGELTSSQLASAETTEDKIMLEQLNMLKKIKEGGSHGVGSLFEVFKAVLGEELMEKIIADNAKGEMKTEEEYAQLAGGKENWDMLKSASGDTPSTTPYTRAEDAVWDGEIITGKHPED